MNVSVRVRKIFIALSTVLLVFMVGVGIAEAHNGSHQGVTDHTVYKSGREVSITGKINGDVYCAGQDVTIDADVDGDVMCAGRTVTVHGKISGNLRVAGQTVTVNAQIGRSASLAGADISLSEEATVGRDVSATGDRVEIAGNVERDVDVSGTTVTLNGVIGRQADVHSAGKLLLRGSLQVGGDVNLYAPAKNIERSPGAKVAGEVNYSKPPPRKNDWTTTLKVYGFFATTLLALMLVALAPQLFRRWHDVAAEGFGNATLTGFLAMLAIPLILLGLSISVIGIPLAVVLVVGWALLGLLSLPVAMYYVGRRLLPRWHPITAVMAGALLVGVLQLLPVIGFFVTLIALWLGSGAILISLKRLYKRPNYSIK